MIQVTDAGEIERCSDLGRWFHYKHAGWIGDFDPKVFMNHWAEVYKTGIGFIIKREVDGAMKEAIGIYNYPDIMTGVSCAYIQFWFTSEEKSGLASGMLFNAVVEKVQAMGAKHLFWQIPLHGGRFGELSRFAAQAKFRSTEMQMVKDL